MLIIIIINYEDRFTIAVYQLLIFSYCAGQANTRDQSKYFETL